MVSELTLLAEELGVSERTLRRAVGQGTLRTAKPTARATKLSLRERRYARRSWSLLSALRAALRTEQNVRFALLFGSAATGTDTANSDLDVLVYLRNPSLERVVDLGAKLTEAVDRPVDVLRLQDAEAEPSLLADLVADGRVLVDRENHWQRLQQRQAVLRRRGRRQETRRMRAALAGIDRLLSS